MKNPEDGDWKAFRRVARRYERELRRIRDATSVPADRLRRFAAEALNPKLKSKTAVTMDRAPARAEPYDDEMQQAKHRIPGVMYWRT